MVEDFLPLGWIMLELKLGQKPKGFDALLELHLKIKLQLRKWKKERK